MKTYFEETKYKMLNKLLQHGVQPHKLCKYYKHCCNYGDFDCNYCKESSKKGE